MLLTLSILSTVLILYSFLFWRNMHRLGFEKKLVFDLLFLVLVVAGVLGLFLPEAAILGGFLALIWFCNRQHWSLFEVGDQAAFPLAFINWRRLRGLKLFIVLLVTAFVFVVVRWRLDKLTSYSLTTALATVILSLIGIVKRLKDKYMGSPTDFLTNLKHKLLHKKEKLTEEQLKLPQNDPFFVAGRADSNSPEEDIDEQVGHDQIVAEAAFLEGSQKQVKKAIERLESGTYGYCEKCGQPIDPERLEANPEATKCIKCAAAEEAFISV